MQNPQMSKFMRVFCELPTLWNHDKAAAWAIMIATEHDDASLLCEVHRGLTIFVSHRTLTNNSSALCRTIILYSSARACWEAKLPESIFKIP